MVEIRIKCLERAKARDETESSQFVSQLKKIREKYRSQNSRLCKTRLFFSSMHFSLQKKIFLVLNNSPSCYYILLLLLYILHKS